MKQKRSLRTAEEAIKKHEDKAMFADNPATAINHLIKADRIRRKLKVK